MENSYVRITSKGRAALLAEYVRIDANLTGCALHEAAWSVQEAYRVSDDDWLDQVLPHLAPEESYCASCEEHTPHLDSHCYLCGSAPSVAVRNV